MTTPPDNASPQAERGLPMVAARDLEDLQAEREYLRGVDARRPFFRRWGGYWKLTGPGWLQSAITLGAGTAGSTILAAAAYGYQLLWLQPVAMALGVAVFAAIGRQTLITGRRPYEVFRTRLHPALAAFWGISVLVSSVVFQFPQYALGTDVLRDILSVAGLDVPKALIVAFFLAASTTICWSYGKGSRRAIRGFERTLKYILLFMVAAFFLVVVKTGIDGKALVKGLFGFSIPKSKEGMALVLGQLGAAVGVNMTFLYPYSLLSRRWGRDHLGLKNFDLGISMFLPFVLATGFVSIACANTLYARGIRVRGAVDAAHALAPLVGLTLGRVVFSLGILSMCFTTMVLEMLIAGFVLSEMLGFALHGKAYKAATMTANIGILGAFAALPFWVPVVASSFNLVMMPVAYLAFFLLQNSRRYLGGDVVQGAKGAVWNILLIAAILAVTAGAAV
ncbi:MAG: divalent metal cation transporter, partial [Candidatus Aminicenantes bacterium]|nr:divalent metal cation transporter [Candidatus Aminicenantes bacterium]